MILTRLEIYGVMVAVLLMAVGGLYLKGRHDAAQAAKPKIEAAVDHADVSDKNAQGARQSAARVDVVVTQREQALSALARQSEAATAAKDAHDPITPDRAARIRSADSELCNLRPAVCTAH